MINHYPLLQRLADIDLATYPISKLFAVSLANVSAKFVINEVHSYLNSMRDVIQSSFLQHPALKFTSSGLFGIVGQWKCVIFDTTSASQGQLDAEPSLFDVTVYDNAQEVIIEWNRLRGRSNSFYKCFSEFKARIQGEDFHSMPAVHVSEFPVMCYTAANDEMTYLALRGDHSAVRWTPSSTSVEEVSLVDASRSLERSFEVVKNSLKRKCESSSSSSSPAARVCADRDHVLFEDASSVLKCLQTLSYLSQKTANACDQCESSEVMLSTARAIQAIHATLADHRSSSEADERHSCTDLLWVATIARQADCIHHGLRKS